MSFRARPALRSLQLILINRDYTRLWYGQATSSVGDAVFSTTLVLWVGTVLAKGKPWAPEAVSGVVLAAGAALLFVGPLAGVYIDRWDKRATMLCTEVLRGGLVGLLAVASFLPARDIPVWAWLAMIYAVVFFLNAAGQFFGPARFAVIGDIVTGEADRAKAAGIAQASAETASIIGPPLAAPLLFAVGLQWALLFNAASYAVSFAAVRSVRLGPTVTRGKPGKRASLRSEFAGGLRHFGGSHFLVVLLTLAVIGQCGIGALDTLNVFFVSKNLHASSHLYGYLGMAFGIGGVTGALFAGRVVRRIGARKTTWAGLLISGAMLVAYSRQSDFLAGVVLLAASAVPVTMLNTAMSPLLLAAAPREYIGRVLAVFYPATQLAAMLAAVVAGWLASSVLRNFDVSLAGVRFGSIDTIFTVSGVLVLLAGAYARVALLPPQAGPTPSPAGERPATPAVS